jgi:hypothetical protein
MTPIKVFLDSSTAFSLLAPAIPVARIDVKPFEPLKEKIEAFARLPSGWHYGSGGPLSEETIGAAIEWVSFLAQLGFRDLDAFPGQNGELLIAIIKNDYYIEIILEREGTVSVVCDIDNKQEFYYSRRPVAETRQTIEQLAGKIWSTSAGFIQIPSTPSESASRAWHSGTRATIGAYRWLNVSASGKQAQQYVITGGISTMFRIRPFFGNSTRRSSQQDAA